MQSLNTFHVPIAGFEPTTLIDYPNELASIIFTGGCNFHCGYCHNPNLIKAPKNWPTGLEMLNKLSNRRKWINSIVITGGEPLVHHETLDLIHLLVENGFKIKLDTNGAFPERLHYLLEKGLLNYVAMDLKTSLGRYHELAYKGIESKIQRSIDLLLTDFNVQYEFRTTLCPIFVSLDELKDMAILIEGQKWIWQQFNTKITLDPLYQKIKPYSDEIILSFRNEINPKFSGKIEIRGISF
ncbi:MAG: anaerobic ribonucleoside-triphosphate reductase activating protein [Candidatus Hodarchaeota archaeon]